MCSWLETNNLKHCSGPWSGSKFGTDLKALLLSVYKSLNGLGPESISDMFEVYFSGRPLTSAGAAQLVVKTKHAETAARTKCPTVSDMHQM